MFAIHDWALGISPVISYSGVKATRFDGSVQHRASTTLSELLCGATAGHTTQIGADEQEAGAHQSTRVELPQGTAQRLPLDPQTEGSGQTPARYPLK